MSISLSLPNFLQLVELAISNSNFALALYQNGCTCCWLIALQIGLSCDTDKWFSLACHPVIISALERFMPYSCSSAQIARHAKEPPHRRTEDEEEADKEIITVHRFGTLNEPSVCIAQICSM